MYTAKLLLKSIFKSLILPNTNKKINAALGRTILSKKDTLFPLAEKLYVVERMSVNRIALRLNLDRKTVMAWRYEGNWQEKKLQLSHSEKLFHQDLYEFARKLMHIIEDQMENGEDPSPSKLLSLTRIISTLNKIKEYEEIVAKKEAQKAGKGLPEDFIKALEDAFGVKKKPATTEREGGNNGIK